MARIESIERQAEKDREAKLAQIEGDKGAKLATEIELVILLLAVPRRLFCFGSLVVLDVVFRYLSLC